MNKTISNPDVETLMENRGWTIECLGPLEISHSDMESFASRYAAELVITEVLYETVEAVMSKKVEDWHNDYNPAVELHSFLSMTSEEYREWVRSSRSLSDEKIKELVLAYNANPDLFEDYL